MVSINSLLPFISRFNKMYIADLSWFR